MHRRKGLKRLAIALGLPYFGFWAAYGYGGWRGYRRNSAELTSDADATFHETIVLAHQSGEGLHRIDLAFTWGVVVPVTAFIILSVVFWVTRGFRSDQTDNPTTI